MADKKPEPKNYAVIDRATGKLVNIALWDGVSPWHPGKEQYEVRLATKDDVLHQHD